MRFGRALHQILDYILVAEPRLGPNFLRKVDLEYAYMHI